MLVRRLTNNNLVVMRRSLSSSLSGSDGIGTVGFIGLGKMGTAMASNMMSAGHRVVAFDVAAPAVEAMVAKGATGAASPGEVAAQADTLVTMLPNDAVLTQVVHEGGLLDNLQPGSVHVSCSTVSPYTARELAKRHDERGCRFVGAPVFARPDGMAARQAFIPVSGEAAARGRAEALLATTADGGTFPFGDDPGAANVVKLCGNYLIACSIQALSEANALAEAEGLDRVAVTQMLNSTIFDCIIYKGYGQRVSERDHRAGGFALDLGHKDVALVQSTAMRAGAPMPFGSVLQDRFLSAKARGWSHLDWSAIGLSASADAGVDVSEGIAFSESGEYETGSHDGAK